MKRKVKFQEGGAVQEPMTAAERRRQNMQRLNQRRATNREQAATRAEMERFNERLRTGTLTPEDMRRMGGQSDVDRFNERMRQGNLTAEEMRRVGAEPSRPSRAAPPLRTDPFEEAVRRFNERQGRSGALPSEAPGETSRPSMRDAVRPAQPGEAPRRPADAMRDAVRPVGPSAGRPTPRGPGIAGVAGTLLTLGPAAMEAYNAYRNRSAAPASPPSPSASPREMSEEERQAFMERTMREEDDRTAAARQSAQRPNRPAAPRRPAPARQREMSAEERQAFMERMMREEADREAAARRSERGFFERMGIRRTNETGMEPGTIEQRRNYLGSGATDTNTSYNKKGGMIKAYREGGAIRQGMQSPKAQEGRAEMAEDVMRRERAREPISDKERKAGRAEAAMDSGPLTGAEKERMRSSGFKKGGMIKPKAKTAMKKGGVVKKAAGGKVAAPKKMMKGGMTSKPKKMMGGGRAMYAKGGMAKGCK